VGRTLVAEDAPAKFEGGVLGSVAPKRFPQMVALVRRGAEAATHATNADARVLTSVRAFR